MAVKLQFPFLRTQTVYDLLVLKGLVSACNRLLVWYQYKNMDLLKLFRTFETALINVPSGSWLRLLLFFRSWTLIEKEIMRF